MYWWQSVILGLVQGLAEFLPISSSGHLVLLRAVMGIDGEFLFYDVMLHMATLVAVVLVLYKDVIALFKPPFKRLGMLVVATIPAGLVGLLCSDYIDGIFSTPVYICFFFLFTAILMLVTEFISKRNKKPTKTMGFGGAVAMGVMQGLGVFPGISRSGSTIFGGTVARVDRGEVATFSFLMSIPIILASALLTGVDIVKNGSVAVDELNLFIGMVTAFVSGYIAIKFMLRLIKKANFKWFSLYLVVIAGLTFGFYFIPSVI